MEEEDVCWVCLDGTSTPECPLEKICKCPRLVHRACMARWCLQQAGRSEERLCRFCNATLPSWQQHLTPPGVEPADPVMSVHFGGKAYLVRVRPGEDGRAQFLAEIRRMLGLRADQQFDVTFECRLPTGVPVGGGTRVDLKGLSAYDAAVFCAALTAADRQRAKAAAAEAAAAGATSSRPSSQPQQHSRGHQQQRAALPAPENERPSASGWRLPGSETAMLESGLPLSSPFTSPSYLAPPTTAPTATRLPPAYSIRASRSGLETDLALRQNLSAPVAPSRSASSGLRMSSSTAHTAAASGNPTGRPPIPSRRSEPGLPSSSSAARRQERVPPRMAVGPGSSSSRQRGSDASAAAMDVAGRPSDSGSTSARSTATASGAADDSPGLQRRTSKIRGLLRMFVLAGGEDASSDNNNAGSGASGSMTAAQRAPSSASLPSPSASPTKTWSIGRWLSGAFCMSEQRAR